MKRIKRTHESENHSKLLKSDLRSKEAAPWTVLIVDDESSVHAATRLSMNQRSFAGRPVQLLNAYSAKEACDVLMKHPRDVAVAMIDVVMETDDAGLQLVEYIRKTLKNDRMRLIIRTGQPGVAPERQLLDHYDIDDYRDKTELTSQKLYTVLRTSLKAYRDILAIHANQSGIAEINAGVFHNIGNIIQGILHRSGQIQKVGDGLLEIACLIPRIRKTVKNRVEEGESHENVERELFALLDSVGGQVRKDVEQGLQNNARQIRQAVEHMADIIRIQQGVAKQESSETTFSLSALIRDAVAMQSDMLSKYNIHVDLEIDPSINRVHLLRSHFLQVMINLIKNSRESIGERMRSDSDDGGRVVISARLERESLMIRVTDDGMGATSTSLEHMFDYGYSTKSRGTGFGLHSVAAIVQAHQGRVSARSAGEKRGMEIEIALPVSCAV